MEYTYLDTVYGSEIRALRKQLGFTQQEFAGLVNVSVKTVERWESDKNPITGPVVVLLKILKESPQIVEQWVVLPATAPLRLLYMQNNIVCTVIDVDEQNRKIHIRNYTSDLIARAFGRNENPSFEDYEEFLESRCFPRSRDKMKLMLRELDLPFYDPLMIVEKTQGRMAEDEKAEYDAGARALSAQYSREFTANDYDNVKKVYSIWICMNVPKYAEGSITRYAMQQENILLQAVTMEGVSAPSVFC